MYRARTKEEPVGSRRYKEPNQDAAPKAAALVSTFKPETEERFIEQKPLDGEGYFAPQSAASQTGLVGGPGSHVKEKFLDLAEGFVRT